MAGCTSHAGADGPDHAPQDRDLVSAVIELGL